MTKEIKGELVINAPAIPDNFTEIKLLAIYDEVKAKVNEINDVNTEEGRLRIKELARNISKTKTAIDKPIRDYLREIKAIPKILEKNARESKERFDLLKADVLRPLEEAQHEQDQMLDMLAGFLNDAVEPFATSDKLKEKLKQAESVDLGDVWPELLKKFKTSKESAITALKANIARLEQAEQQAAELERLRLEAEQAKKAELERQLKEEAERQAAEKLKREAEEQRLEVERRAIEAKQREEAARLEAAQAKQRELEAIENAKRQQIENEKRKEEAKRQAEQQAKEAAELAVRLEREKIEKERLELKAAEEARQADREHRIKLNREALTDLVMMADLDEATAKKVITVIARKEIRNISINY